MRHRRGLALLLGITLMVAALADPPAPASPARPASAAATTDASTAPPPTAPGAPGTAATTPDAAATPVDPLAPEVIDHGRFEHLHLYKPEGPARSTALLFSGAKGWDRRAESYALALRDDQTLVAGIDTPAMLAKLAQDGDNCEFLDGDLENLSRFIQAYTHQDDYLPALLFGFDDAAAIVFGVLAQAPPKLFSGGVGVSFCPHSVLQPPLCAGTALHQTNTPGGGSDLLASSRLQSPFYAVVTPASEACGARPFINQVPDAEMRWPVRRRVGAPSAAGAALVAYGTLAADIAPVHRKSEALPDLPLVEIPVTGQTDQHRDTLAILMSGDGGWAGLDEEVAGTLAASGIPVVGMDSLRYFWTERKPEQVAADVDRMVAHYTQAWKRPRVMLIGYSQGADVMPFTYNRLSDATRQHLALTGAVALSEHAAFEFHVGAWAGQSDGMDTQPEVDRLAGHNDFMIICGKDDEDAICPKLDAKHFNMKVLPGSHHFDGNYELIAQTLMGGLPAAGVAGKTP